MSAQPPLEIFGDEAGNTGAALLDADQRFFVYATVAVTNAEAQSIIDEARARYPVQMPELKAKKLMATKNGRALVAFVLERLAGRYAVNAHDKVLALCGWVFEYIYEPVYQDDPAIFYRKNLHRFVAMYAFAFFTDPTGHGPEALHQFQSYMRALDEKEAPLFFGPMVQAGDRSQDHPFHIVLKFARGYRDIIIADNKRLHTTTPNGGKWILDLAASSLWSHLNHWGQKNLPLRIRCDNSKPLEAIAPDLTGDAQDAAIARARAVMGHAGPLGWQQDGPIEFVASEVNPAIQLADIVASTTYWLLTNGCPDDFMEPAKTIDAHMLKDSIFPDFEVIDTAQRAPAVNWLILYHLSTLAESGNDPYGNIAEMYFQGEVSWTRGEFNPPES